MNSDLRRSLPDSKDRFFTVFFYSFAVGLLLIGWGRTICYWGNVRIFSFGGTSGSIIFPVFFIYCLYRICRKDLTPVVFWKDPLFLFSFFAFLSPLWSSLHDFSLVLRYILPALMGYWMGSYLLRKDFIRYRLTYPVIIFSTVTLLVLRAMAELAFIPGRVHIMHSSVLHHTLIAMMIVMALPLALGVFLENREYRMAALGSLVILVPGLFLASSRIGWLGFFVTGLFYLWKVKSLKARIAVLITPVLVFSLLFILLPQFRERFVTLGHLQSDRETMTRFENWKMCSRIIQMHPVGGIGYSNKEYLQEARACDSHFQYEHPHNLFLQVLAYTGVPGLMLFGAVLWNMAGAFRQAGKCAQSPLYVALEASFIGLFTVNLADSTLNSHQTSLLFYVLVAYLISFCRYETAAREGSAGGPA